MKAVQIVSPGKATFVEVPKPELQPGEALVRTKYVSLCGSDTHVIQYAPAQAYPLAPGKSGHEVIGIVEEIKGRTDRENLHRTACIRIRRSACCRSHSCRLRLR